MALGAQSVVNSRDTSAPKKTTDRLGLIAKILGVVVAVFSVIFGINQLTGLVAEARARDHRVTELLAVSAAEQGAARYSAAWSHLDEAAKLVGAPGIIARFVGGSAPNGERIRVRQEDLAMIWLERVTVSGPQTFTDVVNTLSPTLELGASRATGARKGDLLAHLGWGQFLSRRDGAARADPTPRYREALVADPNNPYALAYLGHWETWRHGSLKTARDYFSSALATGRQHAWVRGMQLSALRNVLHDADAGVEYLRAVNEMRVNGEEIDEQVRNDAFGIYYFAFSGGADDARRLLGGLEPAEQVVTFKQLFSAPEFARDHPGRDLYLAALQEAAGQKQEALKTLTEFKKKLPPGSPLREEANRALRRISARR
jgi:hypothetical protein